MRLETVIDEAAVSVAQAVEMAARLLPAQGPIGVFIHHNTLHAFEDLPFDQAVVEGGKQFGCEPYLQASEYRASIASGRIKAAALEAVADEELGVSGSRPLVGECTELALLLRLLRYGVPLARGRECQWLIEEGGATNFLRPDLPKEPGQDHLHEAEHVASLWESSRRAASRLSGSISGDSVPAPLRFRYFLLELTHTDIDQSVHPLLIRLAGAYLDQGIAQWQMPRIEAGFRHAVGTMYEHGWSAGPEPGETVRRITPKRCPG